MTCYCSIYFLPSLLLTLLWYVLQPFHIPQHFSSCCLIICLCCGDALTVLPEHTSFSMSEWCLQQSIPRSQVPPLHPISCLIWLVDYSQHETQWLVLRHIQNSSPALLCSFSLASSRPASCAVDSLGISLHPLMQCWRHIALVSGVEVSQVVWCQSFASCSDLNCYLLGVSRGCPMCRLLCCWQQPISQT